MSSSAQAVLRTVPDVASPGTHVPDVLPVLPVRDTVVFPLAVSPLTIGQERSIRLLDAVMATEERLVVLVRQDDAAESPARPEDCARVGVVATIVQMRRGEGAINVLVQGLERVRIEEFTATEPFLAARIRQIPEKDDDSVETAGVAQSVRELFEKLVELSDDLPDLLGTAVARVTDARHTAYLVAAHVPMDSAARQEILETDSLPKKLRKLAERIQHELAVRDVSRKIAADTQETLSRAQREMILRQQLQAIHKELGDEDSEQEAANDLRERLAKVALPADAKKETDRELSRLGRVPPSSPEHGVIRTFLEWIADLPWGRTTDADIDVEKARAVLDEDHHDLAEAKGRILESLAVRKLRRDRSPNAAAAPGTGSAPAHGSQVKPRASDAGAEPVPSAASGGEPVPSLATNGHKPSGSSVPKPAEVPAADVPPPNAEAIEPAREPILCFVGPPGVGKTSLAQSIARALGRKCLRISLGGVHDESEIRGHRRTYIGAMPGRVIQALRRGETADPVFVLDEVDKLGRGIQGDPAAALLELLDPAQNHAFTDTYLGVPFDLSKAMFVCTANTTETIASPLLDRMEVIQLSGYAEEDKIVIARRFVVPRQTRAAGLRESELAIGDDALRTIVRQHTREAGVRNLERKVAEICRKSALRIARGETAVAVTNDNIEDFLGHPKIPLDAAERIDRSGVATGLAWTPAGGDILYIEATATPARSGRLLITGSLGDVMRESAQAALTWVRSRGEVTGVSPQDLDDREIHVHVPGGAVPKDGPSAGVAIATALASVLSGRVVRSDVAMTGEITLRGKVLPVGGIKEKVLAAHRAGIRTVILPRWNLQDLDDIADEVRAALKVVPADTVDDVIAEALTPSVAPAGEPSFLAA